MELKHPKLDSATPCDNVLIVPSGIETSEYLTPSGHFLVLIVPSGIETFTLCTNLGFSLVLIVPSGIETLYIWGEFVRHQSY